MSKTTAQKTNAIRKILVIDDDDMIRTLLLTILTMNGWQVVLANSGKKALELLSQEQFDLIILDIQMPEMDGFMFLREIREKKQSSIPIIISTAINIDSMWDKISSFEKVEILPKPYRVEEVVNKIKQVTV